MRAILSCSMSSMWPDPLDPSLSFVSDEVVEKLEGKLKKFR